MKAIIQRERIRIKPIPSYGGRTLVVWMKKPLTKGNKPYVITKMEAGQKFYDLPCPLDNINGVTIV